ncbi:MAG: SpoIIE family protein phosphatase [Desulfobacterales bacterium]|nr:SpoIIE family protein phosphatase [Desulfobacterales bacterium]
MRKPPLILVVEDHTASLDILKARLSANNYEVITATDGVEGLDQAKKQLPDLILLDIMMPKMDGLEVCRRIKHDASLPFMPIILITAKTDSKDVVAGLEAGGDEYLAKPVDHSSLVARVKSMLRIKELHDMVLEQSNQMKLQLKTATKVQSLFWPKIPPLPEHLNIWAFSEPASYVGGDLYDIIPLPDQSILAYVADISGKGVAAALIMAALSTKIRTEALLHENINDLLQTVNTSMYRLTSDEGYFATIVLIRFFPLSGEIHFIRAGHPNPLWIVDGKSELISTLKGISLGVVEQVSYEIQKVKLIPGSSFLLFSDGVIEAENKDQEMFGYDSLTECITGLPIPPCGESLVSAVKSWRGRAEVNDDLTILEIWHNKV